MKESDIRFEPSDLKNIDLALMRRIEELKIHATTNKGWKRLPVLWTGAERSFQAKRDLELREEEIIIFPQIVVHREDMTKSMTKKGKFWGDIPEHPDERGGAVTLTKRINQDKTANFLNANSMDKTKGRINFKTQKDLTSKVVYEIVTIPIPVYVEINYTIELRSDYQTQMNEMIQPFFTMSNGLNYFLIENNGHRYECFFEENFGIKNNSTDFDDTERIFISTIKIRVLGYLMGAGANDPKPKRSIRENAVSIAMSEYIVTGSIENFNSGLDLKRPRWYSSSS